MNKELNPIQTKKVRSGDKDGRGLAPNRGSKIAEYNENFNPATAKRISWPRKTVKTNVTVTEAPETTVIRAKADKPKIVQPKKDRTNGKAPGISPQLLNEAYKQALDLAKRLRNENDVLVKRLDAVETELAKTNRTIKKLKEIFETQQIRPVVIADPTGEVMRSVHGKGKRSWLPWRNR